ncbi:hypothetical protein DU475_21140 [Rhodopseudomonas sp. WA056]|nr:hypothetical protein [Rhodopseudomonas sp. WA056]
MRTAFRMSAVAVALLMVQPSFAAHDTAPNAPSTGQEAGEAPSAEPDPGQKLDLVRSAPVSLGRALAIAETSHPGTKSLRIETDLAAQGLIYRVRTGRDGQVWESVVSAESGTIVSDRSVPIRVDADDDERFELVALQSVGPGMSDAVMVAERSTRGRAVLGELQVEKGRLKFVVVVLAGDDLKEVVLEPPGARLRNPPSPRPGAMPNPDRRIAPGSKQRS